jgi:signal transduction histidine kinase
LTNWATEGDQILVAITIPGHSKTVSAKDASQGVAKLPAKHFDLLRSFALTSLLVMAIIGGLSAVLVSNYLAHSLLQRDAEVSQAFLQSLTEVEGGPEMFRPFQETGNASSPEQPYDLPELVDHIATMPGVVRANLYSNLGEILWSTQADLIGKRFAVNHELEEALQGATVFELKDIKEEQKAEYAEFGNEISRLVENYLPIWDVGTHSVVAVVEIYKAPKTLFEAIESAQMLVWISVLGATVFLYATLFWIVYRANNLIRSQQLRLVESETMAAVGEMASAVAHSVRNPLAAIRSSAELTTETSEDATVRESADDIITETDRVEQWVRELLIFSRPEGNTQFRTAHLDRILSRCIDGYERVTRRNQVKLVYESDKDIPAIEGDAALLGQMFNSVLGNALEAMPEGGTLGVETRYLDQQLIQISISDTGHGISEDRLASLFETASTTKRYGLGIGMLLAKRIANRHGGSISISSRVGHGTTVRFRFPVG